MKLLDILYENNEEQINEDVEIDVPKEKQRVKTIFNALKSGVLFVPFMGEKFKYVLNNDYQLSIGIGKDHNDTILFVISDEKNPKLKIYSIKTDKEMPKFVHVDNNVYLPMYEGVFKMVAKKFSHFNIHLR